VNFKLAILRALANWPERRIALDEIRCEVEIIVAAGDQTEQFKRFSALGDLDIFQSGLVSRDDAGLQITDAGLSLLRSLESSNGTSLQTSNRISPALKYIDDLIGAQERLSIFDLELRGLDNNAHEGTDNAYQPEQGEESGSMTIGRPDVTSEDSDDDDNPNQLFSDEDSRVVASEAPDAAPQDAPTFLRRSFGSKVQEPSRKSSQLSKLFAFIATKKRLMFERWRRHFARGTSNPKTERVVGRVGSASFAFLSLLVVVTCVGAAIALGQIKSLKSDIAILHREVFPLKERLARFEQAEKTKLDLDQQDSSQNKSGAEKNKPGGEIHPDKTALNLSREEIQLIRDYIKPSPSAGTALPVINVGDQVSVAIIPLPSPLTEKVPKLLGARFTTRNGSIIILRRDSRHADAVLPPS